MGRPPRRKERLSKNRTFRIRQTLDDQLVAAADASRRSVSEEIEFRLEQTFAMGAAVTRGAAFEFPKFQIPDFKMPDDDFASRAANARADVPHPLFVNLIGRIKQLEALLIEVAGRGKVEAAKIRLETRRQLKGQRARKKMLETVNAPDDEQQ